MRNKPSVQARCPEYKKLLKQKEVGPIGLAVALRFVNQFVFHEQSKPCYSARLQMAGRCVPGVAFIYDRSNTELLALLLKRVCKEYGVTNTIGNLGGSRLRM